MLPGLGLFSKLGSDLLALRLRFSLGNQILQSVPFFFRIEVCLAAGIVVRDQPLWNAAILLARHVTGR